MHTAEELHDLQSCEDGGHESDTRTSEGEGHVPTLADGVERESTVAPQTYTPPPRPRLYAAAAPLPSSAREHHRQLAERLYEIETERVIDEQQEKLFEMTAQYFRHLLEGAPSPVSAASSEPSSPDDTSSEVSWSRRVPFFLARREDDTSELASLADEGFGGATLTGDGAASSTCL